MTAGLFTPASLHHPGAHSVMIATAAEKNPSCFTSGRPLADAETELAPVYIALVSCR
jgi:hypothetical protein